MRALFLARTSNAGFAFAVSRRFDCGVSVFAKADYDISTRERVGKEARRDHNADAQSPKRNHHLDPFKRTNFKTPMSYRLINSQYNKIAFSDDKNKIVFFSSRSKDFNIVDAHFN
jgi:hypothetical protein